MQNTIKRNCHKWRPTPATVPIRHTWMWLIRESKNGIPESRRRAEKIYQQESSYPHVCLRHSKKSRKYVFLFPILYVFLNPVRKGSAATRSSIATNPDSAFQFSTSSSLCVTEGSFWQFILEHLSPSFKNI